MTQPDAHDPANAQPGRPQPRWQRLAAAAAITTVVAFGGLWVAGVFDNAPNSRPGQQNSDNPTGLTRYPAGQRPALLETRGQTLTGSQLDLASLRGNITVINVWGSWCNPCRAETPELVKAANATRDQGVAFVGLNTRDNPAAARAFAKTFKMPYPSIIDRDGQVLLKFNGILPLSAVPSTVIVDRAGDIAARVIGRIDYNTLRGLINDLRTETRRPTASPTAGPR